MQLAFDFTAATEQATRVAMTPATTDLPAWGAADAAVAVVEGTDHETIQQLVLPRAERLASLAFVAWPVDGVTINDLTHDLVLEVLATLPFAPHPHTAGFDAWLSSTLLATVHRRYVAAKAEARARAEAMRELAGVSMAAWDDDGDELAAAKPMTPHPRPAQPTLQSVLATLDAEDARMLRWRAAGESWEHIARRLGVSTRTARRRHAAALEQARRIARAAPQDWAVVDRAA